MFALLLFLLMNASSLFCFSVSFEMKNKIKKKQSEPVSGTNANSDDSNLQNMNDEGMEDDGHDNQMNGGNSAAHGSATNTPKEIKFNIHHKYTTHNVIISDQSTIGESLFHC